MGEDKYQTIILFYPNIIIIIYLISYKIRWHHDIVSGNY